MGNGISNHSGSRMAISAMADMMKVTKSQLIDLREACLQRVRSTHKQKSPEITREVFRDAMKELNLDMNDVDVFDHLFTMHDKHGEDKLNLLVFLAGVSPLASTMDIETKLLFAFEVFDIDSTGCLQRADAKKILNGINATASYFGDPALTTKAVDIIVEDVYKNQSEIFYDEYMDLFSSHPAVLQFASSGGTIKYGNGNGQNMTR